MSNTRCGPSADKAIGSVIIDSLSRSTCALSGLTRALGDLRSAADEALEAMAGQFVLSYRAIAPVQVSCPSLVLEEIRS